MPFDYNKLKEDSTVWRKTVGAKCAHIDPDTKVVCCHEKAEFFDCIKEFCPLNNIKAVL
jgi:hypothetical protein